MTKINTVDPGFQTIRNSKRMLLDLAEPIIRRVDAAMALREIALASDEGLNHVREIVTPRELQQIISRQENPGLSAEVRLLQAVISKPNDQNPIPAPAPENAASESPWMDRLTWLNEITTALNATPFSDDIVGFKIPPIWQYVTPKNTGASGDTTPYAQLTVANEADQNRLKKGLDDIGVKAQKRHIKNRVTGAIHYRLRVDEAELQNLTHDLTHETITLRGLNETVTAALLPPVQPGQPGPEWRRNPFVGVEAKDYVTLTAHPGYPLRSYCDALKQAGIKHHFTVYTPHVACVKIEGQDFIALTQKKIKAVLDLYVNSHNSQPYPAMQYAQYARLFGAKRPQNRPAIGLSSSS